MRRRISWPQRHRATQGPTSLGGGSGQAGHIGARASHNDAERHEKHTRKNGKEERGKAGRQ
eukprot:14811442-Heterocapsa_arctica.AAC.1